MSEVSQAEIAPGKDLYIRVLFALLYASFMFYLLGGALRGVSALSLAEVVTQMELGDFVSRGLVLDLLFFLAALLVVHLIWAYVVVVSGFSGQRLSAHRGFRALFILFVLVLHLTAIVALNSRWYPTSLTAYLRHSGLTDTLPLTLLWLSVLVLFLIGAALGRRRHRIGAGVLLTLLAGATLLSMRPLAGQSPQAQPNVIIIGIDGLRPDQLAYRGAQPSLAPRINGFLDKALRYDRSYTPMARTHVAWMSLLTGQYPKSHGVRFNLAPPELFSRPLPLLERFNQRGYHSVYAMDERRFNNIDTDYGFAQVVGPKVGAADALITGFADLPIINVMLNFAWARHWWPYLYNNRAYGKAYSATTFNHSTLKALSPTQPNLLSVHYCLLHWPFTSKEFVALEPQDWQGNYQSYMYRQMLRLMDRQFGQFMDGLRAQGYLDNALVVLFSDHGEGLGLPSDGLHSSDPALNELAKGLRGHGTSVLTQPQSDVLMSYARFQNGKPVDAPATLQGTFSLVDIAPALSRDAGLEPDARFEGVALPLRPAQVPNRRTVFVESSLYSHALTQSHIDHNQVLEEAAGRYEVRPSGRVVYKQDNYVALIAQKQLAAYSEGWQLVSHPGREDFLLVELATGELTDAAPTALSGTPERLRLAACNFYREELHRRGPLCPTETSLATAGGEQAED
ncbi:sulfatase-like hydrolase/transferase [Ferrimonas balearica]|uniref:sulfatase-like hydrolase/transferase n=1 Tax=Ferrimonas balearica TaxID=44012 RepID=UPI001C9963FF|nr:sulfatase-like hydrolase/transferase [Ferrimonas balearica]MBY5992053.1 sulfatase-like hydrolase/transferase [Ferrimonas balearica]